MRAKQYVSLSDLIKVKRVYMYVNYASNFVYVCKLQYVYVYMYVYIFLCTYVSLQRSRHDSHA